jgi:hypothetical protein
MRDYTHYELLRQGAEGIDIVCGSGHVDDTPADSPVPGEYDSDADAEGYDSHANYDDAVPPIEWARLAVGDTVIHVSSDGMFRLEEMPFYCVTGGLPMAGSPYAVLNIEVEPQVYRSYYAHQLVWRAFNGHLPDGWEVRHISANYGDNALQNLDIYPATYMGSVDF